MKKLRWSKGCPDTLGPATCHKTFARTEKRKPPMRMEDRNIALIVNSWESCILEALLFTEETTRVLVRAVSCVLSPA